MTKVLAGSALSSFKYVFQPVRSLPLKSGVQSSFTTFFFFFLTATSSADPSMPAAAAIDKPIPKASKPQTSFDSMRGLLRLVVQLVSVGQHLDLDVLEMQLRPFGLEAERAF